MRLPDAEFLAAVPSTLSTRAAHAHPTDTSSPLFLASRPEAMQVPPGAAADTMNIDRMSSTGKGILVGMISAFGSAAFVAVVFMVIYFFRYTQKGRIFLDRIGRPGEYDDEQAFLKEEAEALEMMDDLQRTEYLRAKGMSTLDPSPPRIKPCSCAVLADRSHSLYPGQPARVGADGHLAVAVLGDPGEGCFSLGV